MAKLFTLPWRRARDDTDDTSAAKQVDVDPLSVDVTEVQHGPGEAIDLDPGADAIREGADEAAPDPSSGDLFQRGSAEEQVESGENLIERLGGEAKAGLAPDLSPGQPDTTGFGGVAPAGTGEVEGRFGEDGPSMPGVDDLGPTRPETPGMDEARSETTTKTLDDGSEAHYVTNDRFEGGSAWFVDTPDGGVLEGQEALDHISEHLPTPAPGAADVAEPAVDSEWQQRMAESLEDHTHYGEIRMDALKGSEVNPDPMSYSEADATLDPTMDPSNPDFADPVDEPFDPVDTIDPADLDPGTIDPID